MVYVLMKGLQASPGFEWLVIFQLVLGGLLIFFMDEVTQKWGFGSGVSLFILAGVGWRLFTGAFQFVGQGGVLEPSGKVIVLITSLMNGDTIGATKSLSILLVTAGIFLVVVWAQSLKVEVPLSYDRLRGYGIRWPLSFFYASVIPVILTAALIANLQLFGNLIQTAVGHPTILGNFQNGVAVGGLSRWLAAPNPSIVEQVITGSFLFSSLIQAITHAIFFIIFSVIFAIFWVKTSGMDAQNQAHNILSSGLQIPGFRKDERILESILARYILPLTVMGGAAIGLLSSAADLLGALTGGTSILLAVMIAYQFYSNISQQHALDMHPALKKMTA
jgi:preprotein translocase subunit SecY